MKVYTLQTATPCRVRRSRMTLRSISRIPEGVLVKILVVMLLAMLGGCQSGKEMLPETDIDSNRSATSKLIGKNSHFAIVLPGTGDSSKTLAKQYYNDAGLYWRIEDANPDVPVVPGAEVVIPLKESNHTGVESDRLNTVAILAYHRFGSGNGRLTTSKQQFEDQMQYLAANNFRVIDLQHFFEFLAGNRSIPKRAVMITIDDGHPSTYDVAYPILKAYDHPATVFPYSEYIGHGGLSWEQLREMEESGLVTVQLHSVTHANLTEREPGESLLAMRKRLQREISRPKELFSEQLSSKPFVLAYPYGATNAVVVEEVQKAKLQAGFTVSRGSNAFFTWPYTLHRNQIYSDDTIETFAKKLKTSIRLDPL